jgi:quinol monooxygenase YgiN
MSRAARRGTTRTHNARFWSEEPAASATDDESEEHAVVARHSTCLRSYRRWRAYDRRVIFITAKFRVRPEHADDWAEITKAFTDATRAEPGNLWFDWSRSLDDPTEYVLVEAFQDGDAGAAHVKSDHFAAATAKLPAYLVETPRIVSQMIDQTDWSELGEMRVE